MHKYSLLSFAILLGNLSFVNASDFKVLNEAVSIVNQHYVQNIDKNTSEEAMISGLVSSLDPHSTYISKPQLQKINEIISGAYTGIGIEITNSCGSLVVLDVHNGSPAEKAGIKPMDVIVEANGKNLVNAPLDKIHDLFTGRVGSTIDVVVMRKDMELKFKMKRDKIEISNSEVRLIDDDKIAYIRIRNFGSHVAKKIKQSFNELNRTDLKGVVIDLRSNPGGLMNEAVDTASLFLHNGEKIVSIRSKDQQTSQDFLSNGVDITSNLPIVVIINNASASASEIVAGALQDNKRAQVLGEKSFGKGSVQTTFSLSNGSAIKLTTALYYTPSGKVIQGNGVEPDVIAEDGMVIQSMPFPKDFSEKKLRNSLPANLFDKDLKLNATQKRQLYNSKVLGNEMSDFQLMRAIDVIKTMLYYKSPNNLS